MNSATSTIKQILRHKISNGFVLFTAIWSSAIMPVMPSYAKMLTPDDLPTLGSDPVLTNDDKTEKLIAEYSQSAARFISDKKKAADLADMAQDFARSKVTNAATDEINRWLSKTGNAKFSVDVDKKLSIKNTQLDWLVPWYDSTDLLLFTQHNIHRTDGRLQTNNGIGVRRFTPKSMMGVNAFFDHDLSRYHSRLGFGAEYAQDFLKLSANTYLRASEWRSASELNNDYNARPANGWDLQAEGWLPSYPNIGGNLKFEQYFGDDVALFGKDKRQKDPLATTVGVNWTPFSLMTLSAEHKISGGLSETNAKLEFTWALGKSLAEQLDPTKVGDSRRLLGSRYDFVNRNNNIILEYQKKTLITLSLPAIIQGKTGDEIPLINVLNTKYSLDKLTIHAPEFLMAGGEIILDGALTKIKLPSYKVAMTEQERKKNNLYRFTVTASDSKGNITPQASTFVEVTNSGVLSIKHNEVIKKGNFLANGQDINALTVTARDVLGNVAPDSTVTFTLPAELKLVTQKATSSSMAFKNLYKKMQAAKSTDKQKYKVITNIKGEASVQFTSLTTGEHRVQAVANGGIPIETAFFFIADTQQAHINHFNVLSDNAVADGKSKNKIQFHITDNHSHPIQGAMLQLDAINANATQLSPTDEQGNTEVEVKSQVAGPIKITATLNEQSVTVETHFVFGQLAHVTILELAPAAAGADSNIKISLTDTHGNAVSGADGTVIVNIDGKPTPIIISETFPGSGVYTGKLPGQHSGTPNITVTVDGQTSPPETLIVEQPKTISPNNTDGTGQKGEKGVIDSIVATPNKTHGLQSGDTLDVTVTITDTFGNGLSGLNTNNIDIGKHKGDTLTWKDNGDGSYTTTLPLTETGTNNLTASINGTISPKTDVLVSNANGTVHVDKVKIIKTEKPAAGIDSTITLELTDKHGNPVVGETEVTVNINDQPHTLPVTEISPGIYEAIIAGQLTGNHDISAIVNGKESPNELLIVEQPQPVKPQNPNGTGQKGEQGVVDKIEIKTGNTVGLQSGDKLEITVTVTDAFNNGLSGLNTNNIDIGKHEGDTLAWVDNGDGSYTTTLPLTEVGNNDLTVSINGTASPQKQIQVSNAAGKDKVSKVAIIKTEQPAAGSNSTLTVQLTDSNGNPVVGETEIIVNIDNNPHTLPAKEGKPGIYEITLPALQAGKHNIHASVNNTVSIKESLLVEQPKPISPNNSNGTGQQGEKGVIDKVTITLDHTHRFESDNPLEITVTVTDAFGNGLAGLNTDNIDIGKHKGNTLNWVDNGDGSYTTTLTLTDVGSNDLTASVNGSRSPHTEVQVNNATGASHVDKVNIIKTEKPAAGTNSTVTIALTDKHGNPVIGATEITLNIDGQTHKRPAKEGNPGIYEVTLPALQAGNHNISASVNGKGSTDTTLVVTPPTPIKPNNTGKPGEKGVVNSIAMTTGNTSNLQSGDPLEITVTITDAFNNGLIGLNAITLNGVNGKPVWTDNRDGSYTATITLTEVGAKGLVASIDGNKTLVKPIQISNAAGKDKVSKVEIIKTEKPAAGSSSILAVKLTDTHGNPVVGETEIIVNIDNKQHTLPAKERKPGIYDVTLPAMQTGNYQITAAVNSQGSAKDTLEVKKPASVNSNNTSGTGNSGERGVINNITMTTSDITHLQSGDKLNITVTITDAFNNLLTAIDPSNIILDGYKASSLKWLDNRNGTYTTSLLLTQTGSNHLAASINGYKSQVIPITVSNSTDINKVANVELEPITPSEAGEKQTITVKVTDSYHHPVTAINSMIMANINGLPTPIAITESLTQEGTYTGILLAQNTGKYTVNVTTNKKTVSKPWTVKTARTISANQKDGSGTENQRGVVKTVALDSSSPNDLKSGQSLQLIVSIKDAFGNALEGISSASIQLTHKQSKQSSVIWTDLRNGEYTALLPLTKIDQDSLTVKVNQITTSPLNINVGNATAATQIKQVEIKSITKPAAGETSTITLALTDANNQPITGIDSNAVVSINGAEALLKITETTTKGIYTGILSGQKSGVQKVNVTVGGVKSTESTLSVNAPMPIAVNHSGKSGSRGVIERATLTVSPTKDFKSGDSIKLTLVLKDTFDNPLTGVDGSNITLIHGQTSPVAWVPQQDGTYTSNLLLTTLGKDSLTAIVNKKDSNTLLINITKQSDSTAIHKVEILTIVPIAAGAESTFTVVLTDAQGNLVEGIQNVDVTIGNQKPTNIALTPQVDGSYTGKLPGQQTGPYDVVITANKIPSTPKPLTVEQPDTVTASANGGGTNGQRGVVSRVALSTPQNSKLTSGDLLQLTVELKDRFSNPLKGVSSASIALQHNNKNATLTWTDHNNGSYTATLPSSQLGNNDLKATVNSQESNMVSIDVVSPNQAAQVHQLTLEPIAPSAAGSEQTITLKAVNIYGHGVVLLKDEIKLTLNGALLPLTLTEDSKIKGTYTAKLPAQKTGRYDVNVAIGQKTATQTWVVKAPTTINADKTDGSGTEGNAAVVKTVELQAVAAQGYKSGETVQLTLTLTDAFDNKLTGVESTKIALTHGQTSPVAWVIGKDDTYTADLVLKTLGKDSLVATVNKLESLPVEITVHNNEGKSKVNNVEIVHVVPVAAGSDSTVVFSLTDSNGHPVSNITSLSVTVDQQQPISMQVAQVPTGKYVGTLPGQQSGSHNMVASIPTQNVTSIEKLFDVSKPVPIAAVARDGSGKKGQYKVVNEVLLNVAPTSKHKAGEKVTLTVTLKDAFGNGLKEVSSNSIVTAHQQSGPVIWKDHADGTYTADLLLRKLGSDTLKVTVNNTIQSQDINVEAPQGLSAVSNVELKATNKTLMMGELVELQLTLTDSHGNGVEKVLANDIQLEHNGTLVVNPIWQEKSNGIYTTELPLHKQGKNTFVSRVNNRTNTPLVINVSALTGSANVKTVEFKASINQLAVGSRTELTLTLTDQWNNGVEGVNAADIVINDSHTKKALTGLIWKYQTNGIYTTPTVIPIAGIHSLGATVNQQKSKNVLIEVKPSTDPSRVHNVTLTAIPNVITAGDNVTLSFKVTDVDNNPVIRLNNSDIRTTNIPSKGQIIWKEDDHGLGTYTATTMLSDVKIHTLSAGVGTSTNTTNITVNSPTGKDAVKTITILPIADSNAGQPSSLSISLTDQYNNPVKNVSSSDIKMKINDKEQSIVFMEKNVMNKYIAQLPASKASRYKITVEVNGQSESTNWNVKVPTEIPIASYDKDGLRGSLETLSITYNATKNTVNSAEKVTLKVGLKDKFGNKLTGASSKLKLLTDLQSTSIWKELKDGFYSQELTMNKLHKQPIQVSAGKILSDKIELIVAPAKGVNNVHKTTLETDVGTLEAGKEVTLILALTDSVDNGVIDINNKDIQLTNNGKSTNVKWVSSQNGVYTTKQQLKTVDNYQFKATVNKQPSRIQTVEATYPSGKDRVKNAKITTNLKTFDAGKEVELTLELKDQYGNLVTNVNGADIVLTDSHSAEIIDSRSIAWHRDSAGLYKVILPLTKVGKHTLTATVNKQDANTKEVTVKALKGASNVNEIKSTPAVTSMSAGESTTLTLTMLDKYGNEVADIATKDIKFKNTDDTITTKAQWAKSASHDSVYTAQITLEKVKKHTLLVDVNKQVKNIDIEVKPLEGAKNVAKVELNVPAVLSIGTNANLQLNLKDKFGNGVVTVDASNITMELAGTPTQTKWIESNNGNYTSSLLLTKAGVYPVTVKVNGHPYTTTITIENPKGVKNVAHVSMKSSITADGSGKYITKPGQEFQLTFKLTDQYGNGVTELQATDISLMDAKTSTAIPIKTLQENSTQKGEYTTTVALTQTTQYDLTAEVNKVSDTIQVSVIPFSDTGNTVVVQLKLDKSTIKVGEKADFELKIKDRYGNDVFIDTADIKLLDANNISLQVKWNIEKDTFTRRYTGYLKLATPGKHSISASVVPVRSIPKTITVETGAPVFGPGKSELTANRYETDTKKTFATLYLILKDDNGNPITGKNPRLHSNYWNQPKTITEIEPGKYEANFHNDNRSGIAKITLDNSSIGYNDSAQSIQIINYGEMSITRLGDKKNYSIDEQFPHVGYTGAQFQINPSLWTGSDYSWTVDQNWLYIDSTGIVTLNKQPKDSSKAKVTITGKSRGSNIKNMVYTFTLESWYTHNGKGTPKEALKMCQSPNEVMTQENITLLSKEWGKDTAQKFITEQYFWISNWNFSKYMINANGHMGAFINQINNKERLSIICVQEY
ncbi:TPA: invasin domain 3-containing protein [Providencia rettgeri]